jgi:Leucine-rich repeat (LRR) protein
MNKDEEGGGDEGLNTTAKGTCLIKYTKYKNLEYNNLKKLHLTQLDLERLPPNLNLLTELTEISLEANKFTAIDLTIFPKLKKINLNHNQLQTVNFSGLPHLSHIKLNDNQLSKVDLTAHYAALSELCL